MADTMRQMGATSMEARYLPDAYYARMGDSFADMWRKSTRSSTRTTTWRGSAAVPART